MISKIKCLFGGHELVSVEKISFQSEKMRCVNCCKEFAVNHFLDLVIPWDEKVNEFYRDYNKLVEKLGITDKIKNE
ncbi:MAG: hypothetical protein ACOCRK_00010 [bacterium]